MSKRVEATIVLWLSLLGSAASVIMRVFFPLPNEQMEVRIFYIVVSILLAVFAAFGLTVIIRNVE